MGASRDTLDRIRQGVDSLELIREAVPSLKQAGNRWRGLCPFHNERTPSFHFQPDKGLWHCFGACQEGGDVFKFVMRLENVPFPEALRSLARRAGVQVERDAGGGADSQAAQERARLLDLLEAAAGFYHQALLRSADAELARRYLAQRKVRPEAVEVFRLGFAPARGGFLDAELKKGTPIELLLKAGLALRSDRSGRYRDPLEDRLVFPISDAFGQTVGFGGRVLVEAEGAPKYLNSPETPVYTKGRHLYGLYQGRSALRERGQALLVEGYMDVVGLHQAGVKAAVAPLGVAFSREQGQLLKRYVQEAVLLFDPDEAGRRASWRSAEVLVGADLFVRIGRLPDELDPDEVVLERGLEGLEAAVRAAVDVLDFWLEDLAPANPHLDDLNRRLGRARELLPFLRAVPSELLRREWARRLAKKLFLDGEALVREVDSAGRVSAGQGQPAPRSRWGAAPVVVPAASAPKMRSAEEEVLQLFFSNSDVWPEGGLAEELFSDLRCRAVFARFASDRREGRRTDVAALAGELSTGDASWLSSLLLEDKKFERPAVEVEKRVRGLLSSAAERERRAIEGDVLGMLDGRLPRDEGKISRYQELLRAQKGAGVAR